MNEDLVKMRRATATVMASERQMNAKFSQAQSAADDWLRRAELAVRKGQDELAREALARRRAAEGAAAGVKGQLDAQRRALEQLTANVRVLEAKVVEARNKVRRGARGVIWQGRGRVGGGLLPCAAAATAGGGGGDFPRSCVGAAPRRCRVRPHPRAR